jgi:hypothetical protein
VLFRQRVGAGGGLAAADEGGGVIAAPGAGQFFLVNMIQGPVGGEGGADQALHLPQRADGPGRPAPLRVRGGVDDGLQSPQRLGVEQSVRELAIGVIGHPGRRAPPAQG